MYKTPDFPTHISFTITNRCNLRCKMCGQWSNNGYISNNPKKIKKEMELTDWKRLTDEISDHKIQSVLLRGGEPFLFPDILELLYYINSKGIFISIDTNGTIFGKYVKDIVKIQKIHLTISVDGPEKIHDKVRGIDGCFRKIKENVLLLRKEEEKSNIQISKSIAFTISPYSYKGLGEMPDVARELGINSICINPYYYVPGKIGKEYEAEMLQFGCNAFSWRGFHHNESGINFEEFKMQYERYITKLGEIKNFPYMLMSLEEYKKWFEEYKSIVIKRECTNVEKLIDIQPDGTANFCVDFPDYSIGNAKESSIREVWNSKKAEIFREYRRKKLLAVCYKCGAKFMSEL